MRRTIKTLMFLAVGGLASLANAADHSRADSNWQYYAAGQSSYKISDDDEADAAPAKSAGVVTAVGQPSQTGQEKNALYTPQGEGTGISPTNYFDSSCGCGQNACGGTCLSDCCNCDCTTNGFRLEWLGWFTRGRNTPPLVTTSDPGTAQAAAGVLGLSSTQVLYGNDPIGTNLRNGGRMTYSHLFADGITSATARFWGIEDGSAGFATNSAQNPIIGRPFFNTVLGQQDAFLVAFPGLTDPGRISVISKNDLIGADVWASRSVYNDCYASLDILGGYQFARLDDTLMISSNSTVSGGTGLPVGTQIGIFDSFRTQNEFHGASTGFLARSYRGVFTLEALGKIALGNMRQSVIVDGTNTITGPGGTPVTATGGVLAQPSNIGTQQRNVLAFIPEVNVNLIYNVNQQFKLIGGYSFIYFNNVVLAGNQIDTNLASVPQAPGALSPAPKFQRTDFWVQGISLGGEYRW